MQTNKASAVLRLFTLEVLLSLAVFVASLIVFIYLADLVFVVKDNRFDQAVFQRVSSWVSPVRNNLMLFFSTLASTGFLIPANLLLTAYFLFIRKHRWYAVKIPVIAVTNTIVLFSLKALFQRPRPLYPLLHPAMGYSFPSGHSMSGCCFYLLLLYIVWQQPVPSLVKWLAAVFFPALIICIGLSRIYLHVHYASDVLAGFSMGLVWLIFSLWILNRVEKKRKKAMPAVQP